MTDTLVRSVVRSVQINKPDPDPESETKTMATTTPRWADDPKQWPTNKDEVDNDDIDDIKPVVWPEDAAAELKKKKEAEKELAEQVFVSAERTKKEALAMLLVMPPLLADEFVAQFTGMLDKWTYTDLVEALTQAGYDIRAYTSAKKWTLWRIQPAAAAAAPNLFHGLVFSAEPLRLVSRGLDLTQEMSKIEFENACESNDLTNIRQAVAGTQIIVYYFDNRWICTTPNGLTGEGKMAMLSCNVSFSDLFKQAFPYLEKLNKDLVYTFILQDPRIVSPYPVQVAKVWFVSARDTTVPHFPVVVADVVVEGSVPLKTLAVSDLLQQFNSHSELIGYSFVIGNKPFMFFFDAFMHRRKILNDDRTFNDLLLRTHITSVLNNGNVDYFLTWFPELRNQYVLLSANMERFVGHIFSLYKALHVPPKPRYPIVIAAGYMKSIMMALHQEYMASPVHQHTGHRLPMNPLRVLKIMYDTYPLYKIGRFMTQFMM